MLNKLEIFSKEIELIKDEDLKQFSIFCIKKVEPYFFKVPASTSGKYHPTYTLGKGGLVRHTKSAVKIAESILELDFCKQMFTDYDLSHDVIIFSLIFHDCCKTNGTDHTVFEHPLLASNFINTCYEEFIEFYDVKGSKSLLNEEVRMITSGIRSHMGQWNVSKYEDEKTVLPVPITKEQKFIHLCDYLASRKFINMEV